MEITSERLVAEAQAMALELRLKDRAIAELQARIAQLEAPQSEGSSDNDER